MRNLCLTLAYDGTNYLGWQSTKMGPSIESVLQHTMQTILQEPISLQAASRTDRGVHAMGQVVNCFINSPISCIRLFKSLNALLPKEIAILAIEEKDLNFHPTLDCHTKEYHYSICLGPVQLPQYRLFSWHYSYPLEIPLMKQAAKQLIGQYDFSSFCNVKKNESYAHKIRELARIDLIELPDERLRIEVEGNHFLYKMVRNLVGTLVYIGRGKLSINDLESLIEAKDRRQMGITAPAHGLTLFRICYQ